MAQVLITGFPGFLASSLLPLVLEQRPGSSALCLVQQHHMAEARQKLKLLDVGQPGIEERVELVAGDIREPGLGISGGNKAAVTELFHLAAVYDPHVTAETADAVNVGGTRHVLEFCAGLPSLRRLQYVSTCYVAGDHRGLFREDDLDVGQTFSNHYVRTKFEAEVLVREAMTDGLPATIYRPGMVVGDSQTGQTQKYDGPYFVIRLLMKAPPFLPLPQAPGIDSNRVGLIPRDCVINGISALSTMPHSLGETYALTDPHPPTVREAVNTIAGFMGRRIAWVPLPETLVHALSRIPGASGLLGIPLDAVVDYMNHATLYDTAHATRDLAGSGVTCPRFPDYVAKMVEFVQAHPEIGSAAMT